MILVIEVMHHLYMTGKDQKSIKTIVFGLKTVYFWLKILNK